MLLLTFLLCTAPSRTPAPAASDEARETSARVQPAEAVAGKLGAGKLGAGKLGAGRSAAEKSVEEWTEENRYLAALVEAERLAAADASAELAEQLAVVRAQVGLEREALAALDAQSKPTYPGVDAEVEATEEMDGASVLDAIPAIVEAARGRRIVVLNQFRHVQRHRAFAIELARALRAEGFDALVADGFASVEDAASDSSTRCDSRDPLFGELARTALDLGYSCIASTPTTAFTTDDASAGEQADRRLREALEEQAQTRWFVLVAESSDAEREAQRAGPSELARRSAWLATLTGADPLKIDQTVASPRSRPEYAHPAWRRAAESGRLTSGPKVFRLRDAARLVVGPMVGQADLQVFHPPLGQRNGRSDWLARGRTNVRLPWQVVEQLDAPARRLVQAFRVDEPDLPIPVDQFVTTPGQALPALLLPHGAYRLVVQDEHGDELARVQRIDVE